VRVDNLDDFLSLWSRSTSSLMSSSPASSSASATLVLGDDQQAEASEHLAQMEGLPTDGSWWERWKGPVLGILGVVAGAAQLISATTATAQGLYLAVTIPSAGLQAGLAAAGLGGAAAMATGPGAIAIGVGVGVGLAVYFIPWEAVFRYLREKVLPSVMAAAKKAKDAIVGLLERLMSWLKKLLGTTAPATEKGEKPAQEAHTAPFAMRFPL
jgi:hypothetical protein